MLAVFRPLGYSQYSEYEKYSMLRVYSEYKVCRGSVLRILPVLKSISGFDTAGMACTRGSALLVLPLLAVFGSLVLLILPVLAVFYYLL